MEKLFTWKLTLMFAFGLPSCGGDATPATASVGSAQSAALSPEQTLTRLAEGKPGCFAPLRADIIGGRIAMTKVLPK